MENGILYIPEGKHIFFRVVKEFLRQGSLSLQLERLASGTQSQSTDRTFLMSLSNFSTFVIAGTVPGVFRRNISSALQMPCQRSVAATVQNESF